MSSANVARLAKLPELCTGIAVDGGRVFGLTSYETQLWMAPSEGGAPSKLDSTQGGNLYGGDMTAAGGGVFWVQKFVGASDSLWVRRHPGVRGDLPVRLADNCSWCGHLAASSDALFFSSSNAIERIDIDTLVRTSLSERKLHIDALALGATHVYWVEQRIEDGGNRTGEASLLRMARGGGEPGVLAKFLGETEGLALDETHAYIARSSTIVKFDRVALAGGALEPLGYTDSSSIIGLVRAGDHLYFSRHKSNPKAGGLLERLPIAGGKPETIASDPKGVMHLATDGTFIYYANYEGFNRIDPRAPP